MHPWNLTPKEAIQLQKQLKDQVRTDLKLNSPKSVAGVDVAYIRERKESVASVVVLSYPDLQTTESAVAKMKTPFPYVPGLLSFREIPAILKAIDKLSTLPDLIFVDGHGRAHPRRLGIAAHLGLWLTHPTVGIGKSRLCGEYRQPSNRRGSCTNLVHQGEVIGRVLRTRTGVKPVFVSVGYGLPLEECLRWTLAVTRRFRLPEPIRRADQLCEQSKSN
ncbi:deoxyribonuclease V [Acidobacteria bacterium AH-259-O06]|nr:deoxyribonuclease V [Acidobacteria bacterium AH-259-O06]